MYFQCSIYQVRHFIENQHNPSENKDTRDHRISDTVCPSSVGFPPAVRVTFSAPRTNTMEVNMFPCESTSTPVKLKTFPAGMMTLWLRPSKFLDEMDSSCVLILPVIESGHRQSLATWRVPGICKVRRYSSLDPLWPRLVSICPSLMADRIVWASSSVVLIRPPLPVVALNTYVLAADVDVRPVVVGEDARVRVPCITPLCCWMLAIMKARAIQSTRSRIQTCRDTGGCG